VVAHIFRQLMEALQFLHGRNLFHRDLKTENMLVSREDGRYTLKVADFGRTVGARNRINVNVNVNASNLSSPYCLDPSPLYNSTP
jgi:serine/threonine protein kinase